MSNITLDNVSFAYNKTTEEVRETSLVLKDINLKINRGEFVCFIGSSGGGKSTLIRLLEGLNFPTTGTITINNEVVKGPGKDRCVVFQHYSLFGWLTAKENVIFGIRQNKKEFSRKELNETAVEYLNKVGLHDHHNKYPNQLSGGQQQRVVIARALAMDPEILLMDEPFGAVDARTRTLLQDMLLQITDNEQKKRTVVFVTHDIDEAIFLSTRVLFLQSKHIRDDILVDFGSRRVRADIFRSSDFNQLRNRLMSLFYEDIGEKLDITGALL
jgi:NitT/TauT family transport system ATP-binding protein